MVLFPGCADGGDKFSAAKELHFVLASCHDKDDYEQEAKRRIFEDKEIDLILCDHVEFTISNKAMNIVDEDGNRYIAGKHFRLFAGVSQPDTRSAELTLVFPSSSLKVHCANPGQQTRIIICHSL